MWILQEVTTQQPPDVAAKDSDVFMRDVPVSTPAHPAPVQAVTAGVTLYRTQLAAHHRGSGPRKVRTQQCRHHARHMAHPSHLPNTPSHT